MQKTCFNKISPPPTKFTPGTIIFAKESEGASVQETAPWRDVLWGRAEGDCESRRCEAKSGCTGTASGGDAPSRDAQFRRRLVRSLYKSVACSCLDSTPLPRNFIQLQFKLVQDIHQALPRPTDARLSSSWSSSPTPSSRSCHDVPISSSAGPAWLTRSQRAVIVTVARRFPLGLCPGISRI